VVGWRRWPHPRRGRGAHEVAPPQGTRLHEHEAQGGKAACWRPGGPGATIPPLRGRRQAAFPQHSGPAGGASSLGAGRRAPSPRKSRPPLRPPHTTSVCGTPLRPDFAFPGPDPYGTAPVTNPPPPTWDTRPHLRGIHEGRRHVHAPDVGWSAGCTTSTPITSGGGRDAIRPRGRQQAAFPPPSAPAGGASSLGAGRRGPLALSWRRSGSSLRAGCGTGGLDASWLPRERGR
jgi:hypothetical protein